MTATIDVLRGLASREPADCHELRSHLHAVLAGPQDTIALPRFRRWSRALRI
ncbi:hypothetical protein AB0E63_03755 [Kribbella sp. NPDC026596]|uniref:hypothetical protein n=1 Tax=Kribbella sp. NPDC026596 TaxID=3155122 RepID=UPI0034036314